MKRIHITGNAGSGKSTFARKLGNALGYPVYGLDKIVWQSGWKKTPHGIKDTKIKELLAKPEWIIEGVSQAVQNSADVVIFLDVSRPTCYIRCLKRNWKFLFTSRPELPEHCPEILIIPQLVKIIWKFKSNTRLNILAEAVKHPSCYFVVNKPGDLIRLYHYLEIAP